MRSRQLDGHLRFEFAATNADDGRRAGAGAAGKGFADAALVNTQVDGQAVRFESWMYHEVATQIDFADGEILWSVDLDALPDGSIYPLDYEPGMFELLSSPAEVRDDLPDVRLERVRLNDEAIPGAFFLAGEQLLLGFVDRQLVYVETFVLEPDEADR